MSDLDLETTLEQLKDAWREDAALCGECAKSHRLVALPKGPPMTDFEVEAIRFRLEQRKAHEAILDRLKREADEHRSPEFKAWLAGDRSVWGGPQLGESND